MAAVKNPAAGSVHRHDERAIQAAAVQRFHANEPLDHPGPQIGNRLRTDMSEEIRAVSLKWVNG
jgi:hypothetical protein